MIPSKTVESFQELYKEGYNKDYPSIELVRIHKLIITKSHNKILDYGSGHGANGIHFLKNGFEVTFCDISRKSIYDVKKKIKNLKYKKAEFIHLKNYNIFLKKNYKEKFNVIICMSVINNLTSLKQMHFLLNIFYKILKPGGFLIIDTNYIKNNYKIIKQLDKNTILTSFNEKNKKTFKMCFPTNKKQFLKIIKNTKFKILDIGHYSFKIFNNFEKEDIFTIKK